ncbi:MAG TPA: tetratricopeptide repeat protein [Terriglobia bacterium]|nr:tetratricopeptide repeat protein [Terriglobia bacterium]
MVQERVQFLQQALEANPGDTFARYGLALELSRSGRPDEALEHFEYLLAHHPEYSATYYQAGLFMIERGRRSDARRILEKGIEVARHQGAFHAEQELRAALEEMASED